MRHNKGGGVGGSVMFTFLRLPQVLERIPVSRSAWWRGCKEGKYPKPIKLSPKVTVWSEAEIYSYIEKMQMEHREIAGHGQDTV